MLGIYKVDNAGYGIEKMRKLIFIRSCLLQWAGYEQVALFGRGPIRVLLLSNTFIRKQSMFYKFSCS